jgi:hypothetical protein
MIPVNDVGALYQSVTLADLAYKVDVLILLVVMGMALPVVGRISEVVWEFVNWVHKKNQQDREVRRA